MKFVAISGAVLALFSGTASAQYVVVPAGPPPVVAVPAYSPGVAVAGSINLPGISIGGVVGPRVGGVYVAPPPVVVPPPVVRVGYPYPLYGRPYYYGPPHHHHW